MIGKAPRNTYRLQITEEFDLFEATAHLAYLHDLGVDWVYLSPLLAAETGSTHGYDVVGFDHVDDARGGPEGLAALSEEARRLGMGVLVDIVPNHVGVATPVNNPWWWDVLRHGRGSVHADAFDIDWDFGDGRLRVPVLGDDDLPVEGGPIGHLEVVGEELRYHDQRFPIAVGTAEGPDPDPTAVHARQHYELVGWRRADDELNYRRFFAVNTLAGVRVEDPEVFAAAHVEIRRWFTQGLVDGLRVDHPDGLRDPEGYLADLARLTGGAYVLVEKILEPGEELPHVLGHRRHHRVRRAGAARPRAHRPRRAGAARRPRGAPAGRAAGLGGAWCSSASARWPTSRSARRRTGSCASCPSGSPLTPERPPGRGRGAAGAVRGLPVLPARRSGVPRRGLHRCPRGATGPGAGARRARAGARRCRGARPRCASSRPAGW